MINIVYYTLIFLIIYTYVIFPILLYVARAVKCRISHKQNIDANINISNMPSIGILCAMYNEEKVAIEKVENFIRLNYMNAKLYIGSDGSSDNTMELLTRYEKTDKICVFQYPRRGKVHVINDLMSIATEDIIVFTDANTIFAPNTLAELVKKFSDSSIGAVCGRLKLLDKGKTTGEGFYWRYETLIKKLESTFDCVIGANGAIYAVRRELLRPLPSSTINDDFTISMRVLEQGYGVIYEENAVAYEELQHEDSIEFKRHVRDGAGHYRAIIHLYKLLNPYRLKVFFMYISHRIIRWFVPVFLILLAIIPWCTNQSSLNQVINFMQGAFYIAVFIGWKTKSKNKLFYIPYYFIYINLALLIGLLKNLFGMQKVTWDSTMRTTNV